MLRGFKLRKYWALTLCMVLGSITSMYSQDIPDNVLGIDVPTLIEGYKKAGITNEVINIEITRLRESRKKALFEGTDRKQIQVNQNANVQIGYSIKDPALLEPSELNKSNNSSRSFALSALVEENLKVKKGVNTKFFVEPTAPDMTYKWIFYELDGVTKKDSANTPIAYHKYTAPGIYKITVAVTEANGCTSTFIKNVEVIDFGYCVRKPIEFAFETTSTNLKYTWTATNAKGVLVNEVLNNTTGLYTYTPTLPGDYVIKLTATGEGKCVTVFEETVTVNSCDEDEGNPDKCKNHIAIVLDESGSIDETEAKRIRSQLKSFINEQAKVNSGGIQKMFISLIGLSDTDNNLRGDNILEYPVSIGDLQKGGLIFNWIENYGRRYGKPGISEGSDYWKSGLDVVLNSDFKLKPELVFLITDGCQSTNPEELKKTMQRFDNFQNSPDTSENKPHLYVVGINNGYYVDNAVSSKVMARNADPNFDSSLQKTTFDAVSSSYLAKSLQYLFNYDQDINAFPLERINGFDSASYFAHKDFAMLGDEPFYFSDGIVEAGVGCGKLSEKDYCANCLTFEPEINKEYLLSAWVKEETNIQVKDYENSEINIVFYSDAQALDPDPNDPNAPSQVMSTVTLKPSGAIIDGWQRISGKFIVPENTITAGVVLHNKNVGIPIYFDDLRIHPMDGTVKTFVYDSETFKLMSELDENNYSTFYEYDNEGGLVRVKKETSQGVKTIQETRSGNFINPK